LSKALFLKAIDNPFAGPLPFSQKAASKQCPLHIRLELPSEIQETILAELKCVALCIQSAIQGR